MRQASRQECCLPCERACYPELLESVRECQNSARPWTQSSAKPEQRYPRATVGLHFSSLGSLALSWAARSCARIREYQGSRQISAVMAAEFRSAIVRPMQLTDEQLDAIIAWA